MRVSDFDPAVGVPDLSGKTILVTGGNQGIGQHTVWAFAKHSPAHIYFTSRSTAKAEQTLSKLQRDSPSTLATVIEMDLTSLASVKAAVQNLLSRTSNLDILVLNAGIMAVPNAVTKDGYEIQMGTNHIGHALLTKLLLPMLETNASTRDTRIIVLSSQGAMMSRGIDYSILKTDGRKRTYLGGTQLLYGDSKLANVYWAQQLASRYPAITSVSVHPGIVSTGLVSSQSTFQRFVIAAAAKVTPTGGHLSPDQGAYNTLWCATVDKRQIENGEFYEPVGNLGKPNKYMKDAKASAELWEWTESELKGWTL